MYKIIVLDLDGTTLRKDKTVSTHTIEVLKKCNEKGIKILFATARPPRDAYKYVPVELRSNPIISYNGACIINSKKEVLYSKEMDRESILQLLKVCKENGYNNLCLEINDKLYSNFDTKEFFGDAPTEIVDLENIPYDSVYKCIICSKEAIKEELLDEFPQDCKGIITDDGTLCQIMHRDVSKWTSIKALIENMGIKSNEVIAFGDDYNDVDMLKYAGIGVAMGNAQEDVKDIADFVTDTNMNDGVAKYLESNLLI